jgi:hypothetical protein
MIYTSANIAISDALKVLRTRGISQPEDELLQALQDGQLPSWGLVAVAPPVSAGRPQSKPSAAARRQLEPAWWHHLNSPLDDVVYFDRRPTQPPTPFRAEGIEVPRKRLGELWSEPVFDATESASGSGNLTTAPLSRHTETPAIRGAKSRAISDAINQIWGGPDKIPEGLSPKERNDQIIKWLETRPNQYSVAGNYKAQARAIERVLQRTRSN